MTYYRSVGEVPRKRHSQFARPEGGLYTEELMGQGGFSSSSSLLYHRELPNVLIKAEVASDVVDRTGTIPDGPLQPRKLDTHDLDAGGDPVTGRHVLLANDDVRIAYVVATRPSDLYRSVVGDEVLFVESGELTLESVFGTLDLQPGDYVVIPSGTTHRWTPAGDESPRLLVLEASGHVAPPDRYLTGDGQLNESAPYSERDLRGPASLPSGEGEAEVLVRHRGGLTRYTYAHHPFDVVGWDGCVYPYALSILDFEPIVKRFHAPPPVHQTFQGGNFVVCSFCPRPVDFDPTAVPAPYSHSNVDCDEVLFYWAGDFLSRSGAGVGTGSVTFHPSGFIHGPQPGSVAGAIGKHDTDEYAVMVDTFRPLDLGPASRHCEDHEYATSWLRGEQPSG